MDEITISFDKEKDFLDRLNNTIQTTKNILVKNSIGGIACTDMTDIMLNFKEIKSKSKDDYFRFLVMVKGFDYHELAHILHTKYGSVLSSLSQYLNILEDQRIENIMVYDYPAMAEYFKALAMNIILDKTTSETYFLLYGRRKIVNNNQLMTMLRQMSVKKYSDDIVKSAEKIIDEYLYTVDLNHQKLLAEQLKVLFQNNNIPEPSVAVIQTRNKRDKQPKKSDKIKTDNIKKELQKFDKSKSSDKDGDSDSSDKDGGSDSSDKDGGSDSSDKDGGSKSSDKDVTDMAESELSGIDDTVSDDIQKQMTTMDKSSFNDMRRQVSNHIPFKPSVHHKTVSKRLTQRLRKITNSIGNSTVYNQRSGYIDIKHVMMNSDSCNMNDFKRYKPSKMKDCKLTVSLFIDASSSMKENSFNIATGSAWAISSALESTKSLTQVYQFSNVYRVIKTFNETVKQRNWGRQIYGNTYITDPVKNAMTHVSKNMKNNVVIILSDGVFDDVRDVIDTFTEYKKKNVTIVLIRIGDYYSYNDKILKDSVFKYVRIKSFNELEKNMVDIIASLQKKVVLKVA